MDTRSAQTSVFYFYVTPEFTMLAFTNALEILRLTNQVLGRDKYEWRIVSCDGEAVRASCGLQLGADLSLEEARSKVRNSSTGMVILCAGQNVQQYGSRGLDGWLRECRTWRVPLGAVCTGSHLLARAGILRHRRCTIHWENLPSFSESFIEARPNSQIFEVDDEIYTCAGGASSIEMMLHIIGREHGADIAAAVCQLAIVATLRDRSERQRMPYALPISVRNPNLQALVRMMEDNISEPLQLALVAGKVGISRRQMERYFREVFDCSPGRYYMRLRIESAKSLLKHTSMPVVEVAIACGFISASHFSKIFRSFEGTSPHESRMLRAPAWFEKTTGQTNPSSPPRELPPGSRVAA